MAMLVTGGSAAAMPLAIQGCLAVMIGCVVGGILRAAGSLTLAVQIVLLLGFLGVGLYTAFGSTSNELFDAQMAQIVDVLELQGTPASEIEAIRALQPRLIGFYGLEICLSVLLALLLTSWALGYARRQPTFGHEFRTLRIGYVIGVPSALIVSTALVLDWTLIHNLFGIATLAFMLQGLALVHGRGHAAGWQAFQYVPIYLIGVLAGTYLLFVGIFGEGILT
jgi:hypothetical protein